jgi:hypothetical protein
MVKNLGFLQMNGEANAGLAKIAKVTMTAMILTLITVQ